MMPKHAMPKHKSRKADVRSDLSRLGGRSEARLERDDRRGPSSPLTASKRMEKERKGK
jgi:hypothetical protein